MFLRNFLVQYLYTYKWDFLGNHEVSWFAKLFVSRKTTRIPYRSKKMNPIEVLLSYQNCLSRYNLQLLVCVYILLLENLWRQKNGRCHNENLFLLGNCVKISSVVSKVRPPETKGTLRICRENKKQVWTGAGNLGPPAITTFSIFKENFKRSENISFHFTSTFISSGVKKMGFSNHPAKLYETMFCGNSEGF